VPHLTRNNERSVVHGTHVTEAAAAAAFNLRFSSISVTASQANSAFTV